MSEAAKRAVRRHMREKATIDRIVRGVRQPAASAGEQPTESPTTSTGLSVEEQVRKEWDPKKKGGLPTFFQQASRR
jgi:hypothetical protein